MPSRGAVLFALLAWVCTARAGAAPRVDEPKALRALWPGLSLTAQTVQLSPDQAAKIKALSGEAIQPGPFSYYLGPQGQVAVIDHVVGKHLPISFGLGVGADGKVSAFEVLAYREAYGGQVKQARWRRQFYGRSAADPLRLGRDVDAISGATLSARHLSGRIRRILITLQVIREKA